METVKKEVFNFKDVVVKNTKRVDPGNYVMNIAGAKYVVPTEKKGDGSAKTPYLEVTFACEDGVVIVPMYINSTPATLSRLQYLYSEWTGKPNDKSFDSIDSIGLNFEAFCNNPKVQAISKRITVGGKQVGDKVYQELAFTHFVVSDDDANFKEGAFVPGSTEYIVAVKKQIGSPAPKGNNVMSPSDEMPDSVSKNIEEDGLPF